MLARLPVATMEQARMMGNLVEGRSPEELKGWRVEAQPETRKSVEEAERCPTEVDLEG